MKKTVLICGFVAGLISSSFFIGLMLLGKAATHDCYKNGVVIGYTLMILAFSLIFVGTKITRDKYNGGRISFGKAFRVGLFITLIASTVYVTVWLIDYYVFVPDFAEKYGAHVLEGLKASGANRAEMAEKTKEMARFSEMYRNPFFIALLTYMEIVPVGLVISLFSAWMLKANQGFLSQMRKGDAKAQS